MTQATGPKLTGVNLDRCTTAQEHDLGEVYDGKNGKKYRYVKFEDAITYATGHFVWIGAAETDWEVTNDISAAMAGYVPVGVIHHATANVPTENQYGWVQIAGMATVLIGSAAVIAGDFLKADGTTDGALDEATMGGTDVICAQALATIADAATGNVLLTIPGAV